MYKNIAGKHFGRLTAIQPTEKRSRGCVVWECECECGKRTMVSTSMLISGNTRSCGCLRADSIKKQTKHGAYSTKIYNVWKSMKSRCSVSTDSAFKYYGARGIKVCEEWEKDFSAFRDWALSNGYAETLTIDRINVDGDYAPNNCRWVTRSENTRAAVDEHRETRDALEKGVVLLGYPDMRCVFATLRALNGNAQPTPGPAEILRAILDQVAQATPTSRRIALAAVRAMIDERSGDNAKK
jgi:hypothetical protein